MRRVVQGRRERARLPGCSLPLGFLNLVALDLSFPRILLAFLSPSITFSSLKSQHRAPLPTETFPEFPGWVGDEQGAFRQCRKFSLTDFLLRLHTWPALSRSPPSLLHTLSHPEYLSAARLASPAWEDDSGKQTLEGGDSFPSTATRTYLGACSYPLTGSPVRSGHVSC